jgi:DNA-binding MarR family transcriptional regulator
MQIRTRTPVRVHPSGRRRLGKLISPEELEFITAICPGYNLGKAYKRVTREYEQEFRDSNLSLAQFALLVNIGRREPASGTEIANRLGSDLSTLSRTIDLLVKRGLVCQKRGEDRRVRVYCLTDAGHAALAEVIPKWRQATRRTLSGIEGSRWRRVLRDLRGLSA